MSDSVSGLTQYEAQRRLATCGPNRIAGERRHSLRLLLTKFWAPVPWMLEAAIALQLMLGRIEESAIITALLAVNAMVSFLQENRANRALALLRSRLAVRTRVLRDGHWQPLAAEEIVPGDVVHLRMGDFVPADARLWASRPGGWLLAASATDLAVVSVLAVGGILMAPLRPVLLGSVAAFMVVLLAVMDYLKVWALRSLAGARTPARAAAAPAADSSVASR